MSLLDLTLLPIRIAPHIADAVVHFETPPPAPPAELVVVDGMLEGDWQVGSSVGPLPYLTLRLNGVAGLTVDVVRAGLALLPSSTISVATNTAAQITLAALRAGVVVQLDGQPAGPSVAVPPGRHRIDLVGKH